MKEFKVLDKNYDRQSGDLMSFLILWEDGEVDLKNASPENYLLYIEELYEFLNGDNAVILNDDDPEVVIAPTGMEYAYMLRVNGSTVETTPNQAQSVLQGVMDVVEKGDLSKILDVHREIINTQVRQQVIDALIGTFPKSDRKRITQAANGWIVDGFYLVDWKANMYTTDDDPEEGDYERSGSKAVKTDKSYEVVIVKPDNVPDPIEVTINGTDYELSEREMLFLWKVKWLLRRHELHPDIPFWKYVDRLGDAIPNG